jgi:hypothetical protein
MVFRPQSTLILRRRFSRTMKTARRYEVGFDPAVLGETRRIVTGVVCGSAAEAAGLRNGDEILKPPSPSKWP